MTRAASRCLHQTTSTPVVYLIDYAPTHIDNPEYIETVRKAPPDILHVGHDVPFKSMFGPSRGSRPFVYERLSADECKVEMQRLARYVDSLHRAGARIVIPYICSMFLFGDRRKRTGFWEFYDHWGEYAQFGLGKRPESDPATWMQHRGIKHPGEGDMHVYEPCTNHPEWQRYLKAAVRAIARCGYDGVFSDVNSLYCRNECCRSLFARYLQQRYAASDIRRLFGFSTPDAVRLGRRGEGLLWVETQRFRAWSMARLFSMLEREGARIRPGFMLIPNLSPMSHVDGVRRRIGDSKDVGRWAQACKWLMYEEMQQPGLFGKDIISDYILQYKFAFASGILGGMLLYHARDADGIALAMAEAGAGGGGCLIQGNYNCPQVRSLYGAFWRENRELFDGLRPWSQVGVCYLFDELYWNNFEHLRAVFRIRQHLSNEHVLFDFIVEQNFTPATLRRYRAIILPVVRHLSEDRLRALRDYVRAGGALLLVGKCGDFDELGNRRAQDAFAFPSVRKEVRGGMPVFTLGKGRFAAVSDLDALVPPRKFELFDLTEEESNDIEVVMKRARQAPAQKRRPSPLLRMLRALTGSDLVVARGRVPPTVRVSAFAKEASGGGLLVAHVLNYNVPIRGIGQSGPPVVARNLRFSLPLPAGWRAISVRALEPGESKRALKFSQKDGRLHVTLPELHIYKVLAIRCRPGRT